MIDTGCTSMRATQVLNFNSLCEESLLRYQQTYGLVSESKLLAVLSCDFIGQQLYSMLVCTAIVTAAGTAVGMHQRCYVCLAGTSAADFVVVGVQGVIPGSSKEELVWAVQHHFSYQEVRIWLIAPAICSRLARFR